MRIPDERRRNRGGSHHKWVNAVLSRDKATCQHCGVKDGELNAHHIKSYKDYPALRFELSNGMTLCVKCHWNVHAVQRANSVNSVKTQTGKAVGNTEPSLIRNYEEGVTNRGRASRRWKGFCDFCKTFISKPFSDTKGKENLFCSRKCATTHHARNRDANYRASLSRGHKGKIPSAETRAKMSAAQSARQARAKAVNSSKSAGRESDELF